MATQEPTIKVPCVPVSDAIKILTTTKLSYVTYTEVVRDAIDAGYDLNKDGSLLTTALDEKDVEKVSFLFKNGAQVADQRRVFTSCTAGHVYTADRIQPFAIAKLVLEHTLQSDNFDIIKAFITSYQGTPNRLNVFRCLEADSSLTDSLVSLYTRLNMLPTTPRVNDDIQLLCGAAGLWYDDVRAEQEQHKLKTTHMTDLLKCEERCRMLEATLHVSEDRCAKLEELLMQSQTIIGRLTSL